MSEGRRTWWTDGTSARLCVLLAAPLIPAVGGRHVRVSFGLILAIFLMTIAWGFFWSAAWKSRCRDLWAWLALMVGVVTAFRLLVAIINTL